MTPVPDGIAPSVDPAPVLPAWGAGCVSDLVPALLGLVAPEAVGLPELAEVPATTPTVLLVLDGIGSRQVAQRPTIAPTLNRLQRREITTVAPSTTAAALSSITTGLAPGDHGVVGYRMLVDDQVLNSLRWGSAEQRDARRTVPPDLVQPFDPFCGQSPPVVSKAEFARTGFTTAHLRGARLHGYRTPAVLVHEVERLVEDGESFVYAYWDGVDKVSHEYGLGTEYDAELAFADRLVADLEARLPAGTRLVVTADHGQVDCGRGEIELAAGRRDGVELLSGEGRFRWLHTRPGAADDVADLLEEVHGHLAWVCHLDQVLDEAWFGPTVRAEVVDRLGDIALVPHASVSFADPDDTGLFPLIGRHGSLTSDEMLVPLAITVV
ncbi:MAG: alkaline phosphatase family protein [Acidimicrobiales bacterium]